MREICAFGPYVAGGGDRLRNTEVRWMLGPKQGVDHQDARSAKERDGFGRKRFGVRHVCQRSNPVCKDCDSSVRYGHRPDLEVGDGELSPRVYRMRLSLRHGCPG